MQRKYGDIFQVRIGSIPAVVVNGLDAIKQALVKQADDFSGRPELFSFQFMGNGSTMSFNDVDARGKLHRSIIENAMRILHRGGQYPLGGVILKEAKTLIETIAEKQGKPFDPKDDLYRAAAGVIYTICFGEKTEDFEAILHQSRDIIKFQSDGNLSDFFPWARRLLKKKTETFSGMCQCMMNRCIRIEAEHLESYERTRVRSTIDALITAKHLSSRKAEDYGLTLDAIMHASQELFGAGADTTAATLQWLIRYVAQYPKVQQRLRQELDSVIGSERLPVPCDRANMPFTEAVFLETLRHSQVVPLGLPHATTSDTYLKGYELSKKSLILINLSSLGQDKTLFPDPSTFRPERFLTANGTALDRTKANSFMPFSAGRRRCIGEKIGRTAIFLILTSILQRYRIDSVSGYETMDAIPGLTRFPKDYEVIFSERRWFYTNFQSLQCSR